MGSGVENTGKEVKKFVDIWAGNPRQSILERIDLSTCGVTEEGIEILFKVFEDKLLPEKELSELNVYLGEEIIRKE